MPDHQRFRMPGTGADGSDTADRPFHVMTMPIGPACNLECEYCYYLEKTELYPEQGDFRMDEDTLKTFVKQYIEAQPGPEVVFAWQGGEPTLRGIDFYREAVRLQEEYAPPDMEVVNTIQTNGTRLDDQWCEFFAANDFLVGISVDGPRELHNEYRSARGGGPTFEDVTDGLSLLQAHEVEYNVLCVVNSYNSQYPERVYEFFKDHGVTWLQFIPLVEFPAPGDTEDTAGSTASSEGQSPHDVGAKRVPQCGWVREEAELPDQYEDDYADVLANARNLSVTARTVDPRQYGEFMQAIFDEWVRKDVGEISVRLFDQCLETLLHDQSSLCVFMETCGEQVAMEHNGDVYACDHFVEPAFRRGNIHESHLSQMIESDEQRRFGEIKREGLPPRCHGCPVQEFCHGGCPKNRHLESPAGDLGLNYLCAGYRYFFAYIQPYLACVERTVETGLPLPSVMDEVAVRDRRASG